MNKETINNELRNIYNQWQKGFITAETLKLKFDEIKTEIYPRYERIRTAEKLNFKDIDRLMKYDEPMRTVKTLIIRNV